MEGPAGEFRAMPEDISLDGDPVEFILAGENLLLRVQQVAHQIEQRVSKAIRAHGPPARHGRSRGGVPVGGPAEVEPAD
jgi:hypothetical protein